MSITRNGFTFTEREMKELHGYLLTQLRAKEVNDSKMFCAAACAVISFAAEHGTGKTSAIAEEIQHRHDVRIVMGQLQRN